MSPPVCVPWNDRRLNLPLSRGGRTNGDADFRNGEVASDSAVTGALRVTTAGVEAGSRDRG